MQNYTMKLGIVTCMICMFAVALTMGGPIRRQASQSEKTVPIGGDVTLLCPMVPNDKWIWVYWKKNDLTVYSLEIESNTPWTNDTRYEGSNHATRLTIKDLKKTDSGIYHCKVATLVLIEEGGQVLLSVTDQDVGPSSTSPGVSFRASTKTPPQPAEHNKAIVAFSIYGFLIGAFTVFIVYKYGERIKNFLAGSMSAFNKLLQVPKNTSTPLTADSSHHETRDKEGTSINLLSSDTQSRDVVDVHAKPKENSNASQALKICKTNDGTI